MGTKTINKTYVINKTHLMMVALIVGAALVGYFVYQRGYEKGNTNGITEGMRIEKLYYNEAKDELKTCLDEAEAEYKRVFTLNSVEGTTPGGVEARKWNNDNIASKTKEQYNQEREFCLKLYK